MASRSFGRIMMEKLAKPDVAVYKSLLNANFKNDERQVEQKLIELQS